MTNLVKPAATAGRPREWRLSRFDGLFRMSRLLSEAIMRQPDDLTVVRQRAKRHFDGRLQTEDRAVLLLLTQLLARLAEAASR